jgi:peroxiredoxin
MTTLGYVLLGARLLLAAVLVVSAVAKAFDVAGTRGSMLEFGFPTRLARAGAWALPALEAAIGLALLPAASAWWAALGAAALFAAFTVAVGQALLRGRRPDCHCFGRLAARPIGGWTLARNLALTAVAGGVAVQGPGSTGPSAVAWVGGLTGSSGLLLTIAVVLLASVWAMLWLLLELVRQNGRILVRLDAIERRLGAQGGATATPAAGDPAPALRLPDREGREHDLAGYRGRPAVLLFWNPDCAHCRELLKDLVALERRSTASWTALLVIASGQRAAEARVDLQSPVLVDPRFSAGPRFGVEATPSALLVDEAGRIASEVVTGPEAVLEMLERNLLLDSRQPGMA